MNIQDIKTKEEFNKAKAEYMAKNPAFKEAKPIECLNLLLRKEFAKQILSGEKTVEFRAFSEHYSDRLLDKDAGNWIQAHIDDEEALFFANHVRKVNKIHFHNYNNTWTLDVECAANDYVAVIDKDVKFLQDNFDCHELDEQLADFNKRKENNRPIYFFFALGEVIESKGL